MDVFPKQWRVIVAHTEASAELLEGRLSTASMAASKNYQQGSDPNTILAMRRLKTPWVQLTTKVLTQKRLLARKWAAKLQDDAPMRDRDEIPTAGAISRFVGWPSLIYSATACSQQPACSRRHAERTSGSENMKQIEFANGQVD
jgi:hypothetical protein